MSEDKFDAEKFVGHYVKLRDEIKRLDDEHKKKLEPYKERLEQLSNVLLKHLNDINGDSIRTGAGTVTRTQKDSASIKDMEAFWTFVVARGDFDMVDRKANVTAVREYIEEHKAAPPGVNYAVKYTVGVRRK